MLIKPEEGDDFQYFVENYQDLLDTWFYDIRGWTPGLVATEREVWVRCQGVPLQAWCSEFFEMVVVGFGRFVSLDYRTMNGKRFDIARILLRTTSWETINQIVKVPVNDLFFNIRVIEEPFQEFCSISKNPVREDGGGSMSSSSSETLSLSKYFNESEYEDSTDPDDELLIQKLMEVEQLQEDSEEECRRQSGVGSLDGVENSKGFPISSNNEENNVIAFVGDDKLVVEEVSKSHNVAVNNERILTSTHNSEELFVQLGPGPLVQIDEAASIPILVGRPTSDPINNWDKSSGSNNEDRSPTIAPNPFSTNDLTVDHEGVERNNKTPFLASMECVNKEGAVGRSEINKPNGNTSRHHRKKRNGDRGGSNAKAQTTATQRNRLGASRNKGCAGLGMKEVRPTSEGMSVNNYSKSCSNLSWRNCMIENGKAVDIAKEVWNLGKSVVLKFSGPKNEIINRLVSMEERDRRDVEKVGGSSGLM